eukprot:scaffold87_cov303-Chaetoceros_neogracile.AAC.7
MVLMLTVETLATRPIRITLLVLWLLSWKEPERDSRGVFTVLFWDGSRAYTSGNAPTSTEAMIVTLIANTH